MTAHPCVFQMWRYCHVRILWNVNMFPKLQTRVQCELIVGYAAVNGLGLTQNRRLLNAESLLPCIPRNINSVWIYTCFNASQATYVLQPNIYILVVSYSRIQVQAGGRLGQKNLYLRQKA
ncbi:Hypothetical_protein [Hexamita inflata]|uniref:Hypothetical_protein n=1 Tax=Hexamita inflata TaxID=28002 RepID=A0AA86R2J1_9EUKA|nr:Hypothetical protein HINF_LOCUS58191 [Hexamita inflata]